MLRIITVFFLFLFFLNNLEAVEVYSDPRYKQTETIKENIELLVRFSFPELKGSKIFIKTKRFDDHTLFSSFFKPGRIFRKRSYKINVSPQIWELGITPQITRSILAHELAHTLDYDNMRFFVFEILSLGWRVFRKESNAQYERKTDLVTISRGYHKGLKAHRLWLYQFLNNDELKRYKKTYFTPEEIDLLVRVQKKSPMAFQDFFKNIPKNINEIQKVWKGL